MYSILTSTDYNCICDFWLNFGPQWTLQKLSPEYPFRHIFISLFLFPPLYFYCPPVNSLCIASSGLRNPIISKCSLILDAPQLFGMETRCWGEILTIVYAIHLHFTWAETTSGFSQNLTTRRKSSSPLLKACVRTASVGLRQWHHLRRVAGAGASASWFQVILWKDWAKSTFISRWKKCDFLTFRLDDRRKKGFRIVQKNKPSSANAYFRNSENSRRLTNGFPVPSYRTKSRFFDRRSRLSKKFRHVYYVAAPGVMMLSVRVFSCCNLNALCLDSSQLSFSQYLPSSKRSIAWFCDQAASWATKKT